MQGFEFLWPILIAAIIVFVIFLIILIIKLINVMEKVNLMLDDVNKKLRKVDGLFELIEHTTDCASNFGDKIKSSVSGIIKKILKKKKGTDEDE